MTPIHDRGLAFDLATLDRRRALTLLGGAGLAVLSACGSGPSTSSSFGAPTSPSASSSSVATAAECGDAIPEETAGPYPGDGSNGPNALTQSGILRSDIRTSFGTGSRTAEGVPLTITLTVQNTGAGCTPYVRAAVYLWHCDIDGKYSMYSQGITDENYLRGVQVTNARGMVTFKSIFPAAYSGRWPHIHFEVYPSLTEATKAGSRITTSQLALPENICKTVYGTAGYVQSVRHLAQTSLETDNVFRDGHDEQLADVTGDVISGYTATLTVAV
ncbi:protocatechuate 3,4-dioxygenase beta subunit [Saccharothrix tamanrassetensis]|uniref:Protocatechuate 3,4-dioxygenase beta subunit n=1 Tax=Saccharothrix tamanrassetensis TaxID=1051531 RepID=A0A841CLT2_9PSEU|nr:intradiol ring-cleavage dioxygenase [Saccharothrix tamanrassetensis]MBB5956965.1 protocatechuate 3,4-dioxygenase beta subunit [Saccharothrix tamanrassetensis]